MVCACAEFVIAKAAFPAVAPAIPKRRISRRVRARYDKRMRAKRAQEAKKAEEEKTLAEEEKKLSDALEIEPLYVNVPDIGNG